MDSNKKIENGELSGIGTLKVSGDAIKTVKIYKIIENAEKVGMIKNPFYLTAEVKATLFVADYTTVSASIGIKAPVDITDIGIKEAYEELKEICFEELTNTLYELKEGIMQKEGIKYGRG